MGGLTVEFRVVDDFQATFHFRMEFEDSSYNSLEGKLRIVFGNVEGDSIALDKLPFVIGFEAISSEALVESDVMSNCHHEREIDRAKHDRGNAVVDSVP